MNIIERIYFMIIHFAQQDVFPTGQEDFSFAYAIKNKALHRAASKWFSVRRRRINGNICYISMNHFETATATK